MNKDNLKNLINKFMLVFPPILTFILIFSFFIKDTKIRGIFLGYEDGLAENLTNIFLFIAIIINLISIFSSRVKTKFEIFYLIILTLGCIYFLGEEMSWGQHIFKWKASHEWRDINIQKETNFHNLKGFYGKFFSRIPRACLSAFILIISIFIPLIQIIFKNIKIQSNIILAKPNFYIISGYCLAITMIFRRFKPLLKDLYDKGIIKFNSFAHAFNQTAEINEFCIAMFLLFYIYSIYIYLKERN